METWDAIRARRNVREFQDRPIADDALDRILEAGRRAPSSRNSQSWDFIVVSGREDLRALSGVWRGGDHIARAAAAVAILVPTTPDPRVRERCAFDAGQAAMGMMIAAADLGIGSCHSAIGDQVLMRRLLGSPEDREGVIILSFGVPKDRPLAPVARPERRAFDDVVHRDRW